MSGNIFVDIPEDEFIELLRNFAKSNLIQVTGKNRIVDVKKIPGDGIFFVDENGEEVVKLLSSTSNINEHTGEYSIRLVLG